MSTAGTLYEEVVKLGFAKLLGVFNPASVALIDIITPFANTAMHTFLIQINEIKLSVDGNLALLMSADGGASWRNSTNDYWWSNAWFTSHNTPPVVGIGGISSSQTTTIYLSSQLAGYPTSGHVFANRGPGGGIKMMDYRTSAYSPNAGWAVTTLMGGGGLSISSFWNGIRFFATNGGIISSGTFRVYALRDGT